MSQTVQAVQFHRFMSTGRTSPALCGCEYANGQSAGDFVVKLRGGMDRGVTGLASEVIASGIASYFGIPVPQPALVSIEPAFADLVAISQPEKAPLMRGSAGLNFGSRQLNDVMTWPVDKAIPDALWATAVNIFAFDALMQNPDRRYSPNPNLFSRGNDIFVFDHELAFSFIEAILPSKTPWQLDQSNYLTDHVFFKRLKGRAIDVTLFTRLLESLPDGALPAIMAGVPAEWNNGNLARISGHLHAMAKHSVHFGEENTKETRMRTQYSFSILRYVHDPVTQEFVNIGVAVYSPEAGFFRALCTTHYTRITQLFAKIDGNRFRQMTRYIQEQISAIGESFSGELPLEQGWTIQALLGRVLPPDDSSIQFSNPPGVGLSSDLERTLAELFDRYVERYAIRAGATRRDDEDIWRVFREPLEQRHVTAQLSPKRIVASNYDYEFERAWKNEIWHVYEPVSFDMVDAGSILDKANRWLGRATSLNDSSEQFKIHMLLGEPQDQRLQNTFLKAQNILDKMPGQKEFISESEAEAFAEELAREVRAHKS